MPYVLIKPDHARRRACYSVRGTEAGVYIDRSTGCADRKAAEAKRKEWVAEARLAAASGKPSKSGPTFAAAADAYVRAGGSERYLAPLIKHFGKTPAGEIGQAEVDAAAALLYPDAQPQTHNRQVYTPVSAVLKRAKVGAVIARPIGAAGQPRIVWHTVEQQMQLIAAAETIDRDFSTLIMFLFFTGCRLGEALALRPGDLHLDAPEPYAYVAKTKQGTPYKPFLQPHLVAALRGLPAGKLVFQVPDIYGRLKATYKAAGIDKPEGIAFHITRHSWATGMGENCGASVQDLVDSHAWNSAAAASIYRHVLPSEAARKALGLPYYRPAPNLKVVVA